MLEAQRRVPGSPPKSSEGNMIGGSLRIVSVQLSPVPQTLGLYLFGSCPPTCELGCLTPIVWSSSSHRNRRADNSSFASLDLIRQKRHISQSKIILDGSGHGNLVALNDFKGRSVFHVVKLFLRGNARPGIEQI